jgi:DNA mismatch repair ATPase MutL
MFVYVNNRPVDFPSISKLINLFVRKWFAVCIPSRSGEDYFLLLFSAKRYPFAVINIEMKPDAYDGMLRVMFVYSDFDRIAYS